MQKILKTYLNRLINLKSNNRSIFHSRILKQQDMDVFDLNYTGELSAFEIVEQVLAGGKSVELCKSIDSRNESSNEVSKRLKKISRKNKQLVEERGVQDLFLAWPYVQGKLMDGTLIRCPLIFFPVELGINAKNNWIIKRRTNVTPVFNRNFLLAYAHFNEVILNEDLLEEDFCEFSGDSTVFRTQLYELLKDQQFEINFNQELFSNQVKKFIDIRKDDFERSEGNGQLKLMPNAVLGVFPQHSSFLFPDYTDLIEQGNFESIEGLFKSKFLDIDKYQKESLSNEQYLLNTFPIDAHQEKVLKKIKEGNSLVVQGPPGTGKSQLISNVITDFMARGKKVLVVCQKRAALDVVFNRLSEKGIQDFLGLVHDFQSDRKKIYEKIDSQVQNIENYQLRNNKLDTVYQERRFKELSNEIQTICQELDEFKEALFDSSHCGRSIKELYLSTDQNLPFIDLQQQVDKLTFLNLNDLVSRLRDYLLYAEKFDREEYVLKDRVSFASFQSNDLKRIELAVKELLEFDAYFKKTLKTILVGHFEMFEADWVLERKEVLESILQTIDNEVCYNYFKAYVNDSNASLSRIKTYLNQIEAIIQEGEYDYSINKKELGEVIKRLQSSKKVRNNPVKWFFWRLFSKDRYIIKRALVSNALELNRKSIKKLEYKMDARLNVEHNISMIKGLGWVQEIPEVREPQALMEWVQDQKYALEAKELYDSLRSFKQLFSFKGTTFKGFEEKIKQLFALLSEVKEKQKNWSPFLSKNQIEKITDQEGYYEKMKRQLKSDFDSLIEYDQTLSTFQDYEFTIIDKLKEATGSYKEEEWIKMLENGLGLAWIEKIESKHPVLRKASTKRFDKLEKDLQLAIKEKRLLSHEIMLMKAKEITYHNAEYNRLKNMTTYRELHNQVTKKRRIWPLRKLVENFREELFDLMPCWLCSPETASAIFPLENVFDVVIFDEASQCYSEKSIPAIARGKQVVVVGDSKQLSPNDLYQVRWEEEDTEDMSELEAESVLDLASFYLESISLRQHYRSRALELIDFSNQHFYKGKLQLIPDWKDITDEHRKPIEYLLVKDGEWENNSNRKEASEVVRLVISLLKEQKEANIGVVTFNFNQQQLILDMLEEKAIDEKLILPDDIFVKNIENVQGDERDIIIFSTGYAKDKSGRLRMNFGSLNMIKGENRLNVAVTRARNKVYIISSLHPEELKVEDSKHDGPKLFKAYLKHAFAVSEGDYTPRPFQSERLKSAYYLKKKLLEEVENASLELPFADVTIKDEQGKYKSLILTDDDLYYESRAAKDAHAYYPLFLKHKHWKFERRYSRDEWLKED